MFYVLEMKKRLLNKRRFAVFLKIILHVSAVLPSYFKQSCSDLS